MHEPLQRRVKLGIASFLGLALAAAPIVAIPAQAATDGTGVVINEAYLSGGSTGATYKNKFVELYNPTDGPINLSSMSLQYRAPATTTNPTTTVALSGTIPAKGYFLVQGSANGGATPAGAELPTPDLVTTLNLGRSTPPSSWMTLP